VYGIKDEENVTEDLALNPLTDYSRYKAVCESILLAENHPGFTTVVIRPATVCGYAPRLRLDLIVNILTNHAVNTGRITVFGGGQKRPHIHIEDVTDLYVSLLDLPDERIHGKIFNAGYENRTVSETAGLVRDVVIRSGLRREIEVVTASTDDNRSYHICSDKIKRELGFEPRHTTEDAVRGLCAAFANGLVPHPMTDPRYYNIKTMQAARLG
jgi:nucleoside-diphosphate-sugar epimerase